MKKIIRDTIFILILFAAVLAAPFVIENFSTDTPEEPEPQQQAQEQEQPEEKRPETPGLPPQPVPADLR